MVIISNFHDAAFKEEVRPGPALLPEDIKGNTGHHDRDIHHTLILYLLARHSIPFRIRSLLSSPMPFLSRALRRATILGVSRKDFIPFSLVFLTPVATQCDTTRYYKNLVIRGKTV